MQLLMVLKMLVCQTYTTFLHIVATVLTILRNAISHTMSSDTAGQSPIQV